jgi:riboflavin kinase/FMN adenylyltransferase
MSKKCVYALGFFDGVHLGHGGLLTACRELADELGVDAGVVTFSSHPDTLVSGQTPVLLNTIEDRKNLLFAYGMDAVVALPFDKALMTTHWSAFLTQLVEDGAAGFVCGSDFRFGAGGSGTAKKLEAFCKKRKLPYAIVPQQLLEDIRVSSTYIRQLLADGDLENANRFLGHPHILTGEVVPGRGLGRTIGVPTANVEIPQGVLLPRHGVYACKAVVENQEYLAVTNVGSRPTVEGHHVTVEPWLLDFSGDLYGKELTLEFHAFLRPEKKFPDLEALKAQIQKDAAQTRALLG